MRYLTARYIYLTWSALRDAYKGQSRGATFRPERSREQVMPALDAAAARPRHIYGGVEAHPEFFQKVAALGHAISANHCFGNGNKRTAFLSMSQMLLINGWVLEMPDNIVALAMLRTSNNDNRMKVADLADVIASYASIPTAPTLRKLEFQARKVMKFGLVIEDGDAVFPVPQPAEPRKVYFDRMNASMKDHVDNLDPEEFALMRESFVWPVQLRRVYSKWTHMQVHNEKVKKRHGRRVKHKRLGKRPLPHKGRRSIKKICPPITPEKCGIHGTRRCPIKRRG